jgi:DNA-directed RNA polymerase subunit H (RpoH/RPB5)
MSTKKKEVKAKKEPVDVSQHTLVPKHTKMSEKEKTSFLKDNDLKFSEIPKILITDPAIALLDPHPGDIIRIERKSPTAGWSIFYRGVVIEH